MAETPEHAACRQRAEGEKPTGRARGGATMSEAEVLAFCRARLDEEAENANPRTSVSVPHEQDCFLVTTSWSGTNEPERGTECNCGLPKRTTARIEADRAILDRIEEAVGHAVLQPGVRDGRDPDERETDERVAEFARTVLESTASRYAGHPDYRADWRLA